MDIAKRVKELRESQGLSMRKLAERAGLSQAFISGIEAGEKQPTLDSLFKLSSGLGISLLELLGGNSTSESLPEHLRVLLENARHLTPGQINALNHFIKAMTEPSASLDMYLCDPIETLAAHRVDDPMTDLPTEALKSVAEFKDAMRREVLAELEMEIKSKRNPKAPEK